jgi:pre-rRNA-processing protein IPI3
MSQQQGSATASEIEIEKLKHEYERTMKMANQWKKMYENLHQFGIKELLDGDQIRTS